MDKLRFALLIVGVVIVGVVYWSARRRNAAEIHNTDLTDRIEPGFDDVNEALADFDNDAREAPSTDDTGVFARPTQSDLGLERDIDSETTGEDEEPSASMQSEMPQKVITLRVVAKGGAEFGAEDVVLALRAQHLQHGRFGIFHRLPEDGGDESIFSVASLTEPGTFDLKDLREKRMAGLSFFMLRPGPGRGVDAFDRMTEAARAVAITLQGELLDGEGSTLSIQRERFLREDLIQYELKHLKLE